MMREPKQARWTFVPAAVALVIVGIIVLVLRASGSEAAGQSASGVVASVLDGATVELTRADAASGRLLSIELRKPVGLVDPKFANFWTAEVRWRAAMGTAVVSGTSDPSIVGFEVNLGVKVPPLQDSIGGSEQIKEGPGYPTAAAEQGSLRSLSIDLAEAQVKSSGETLVRAGLLDSFDVNAVVVDGSSNAYGLLVRAEKAAGVAADDAFFGNALNGFGTGLTSGSGDLIDGLAVIVMDRGEPLAGSFYASAAGMSQILGRNPSTLPAVLEPDLKFDNLTGGPDPVTTVLEIPPRIAPGGGLDKRVMGG